MKKDLEKLTEKCWNNFEKFPDKLLNCWFSKWPKNFNDWARMIDRKLNKIQPTIGHSRWVVWLGIALLLIIIIGPTASLLASLVFNEWPGDFVVERIIGLIGAVVGVLFLWWAPRKWPKKQLHTIQCIVLMLLGLLFFFFLPDKYTEASGAPFPHIYALMIFVLMFLTIVARLFSDYVMKTMLATGKSNDASNYTKNEHAIKDYARLLAERIHDKKLDLMVNVQDPPLYSRPNALRALFSAPARKPLLLALFPAIAAIMVPNVFWARIAATIVFLFCWTVFSWSMYYRHWDLVISYFERLFMLGGPMFVSILVIALGIGQVFNIQYITTALQGGPIFYLVVSAYLVFWLFEYWINKFFYENLIRVFNTGYTDNDEPWSIALAPNDEGKVDKISLLGSSRFLVEDAQEKADDPFRIYMPLILLDRLALDRGEQARNAVREVRNRIRTYFSLRNIALFCFIVIFLGYQFFFKDPNPMIVLKEQALIEGQSNAGDKEENLLVKRLKEIASGEKKKAVLIAASGGGNRAALYATSVLCGLHQLGIDKNITMLSTVSGGSAAAAYYAANIDTLKGHCDTNKLANSKMGAWQKFFETMKFSYIDDVLGGVVERRIIGPDQNGVLLAESFQRHFESNRSVGEVDEFGLVFNSTLTGHPYHESQVLAKLFSEDAKSKCINGQYKVHAGSRLIITNLSSNGFPTIKPDYASDAFLNYVVINNRFEAEINKKSYKSVPLFAAAALSANFPPVFSDAGVQVNRVDNRRVCSDTYWVTDGGATDNRGFVSLLYALLEALNSFGKTDKLPELHVVVAEASAEPIDYNQIRGIGGKLGASAHLTSQLSIRLIKDIHQLICEKRKDTCENGKSSLINIHYLELPVIFRTRGGLGTHWKLPLRVVFSDPKISDKEEANNTDKKLWKSEALNLMAKIHGSSECKEQIDEEFNEIREWICDDDSHQRVWSELKKKLKPAKNGVNKTQ